MSKLTIYIPAMTLKRIDMYCKENNVTRSRLLVESTLRVINSKVQIKCDFCNAPAIGQYMMRVYDWEHGEKEEQKKLCTFHHGKAKREGAIE